MKKLFILTIIATCLCFASCNDKKRDIEGGETVLQFFPERCDQIKANASVYTAINSAGNREIIIPNKMRMFYMTISLFQ